MLAGEHGLPRLIKRLDLFDQQAVSGALGIIAFLFDGGAGVNRIADKDWFDEAHPVIAIGESGGVDVTGGQANGNRQDQRAVRDPPLKLLRSGKFLIHVMGEKIATLSGM